MTLPKAEITPLALAGMAPVVVLVPGEVVELVELTDEDPPGELPPQLVRRRVSAAMPSVLMRAILWR